MITYGKGFIATLFIAQIASVGVQASTHQPVTTQALDLNQPVSTENLIQAGQFGGPLYPTNDTQLKKTTTDSTMLTPEIRSQNKSFGQAIQAWNLHQYKKSYTLFNEHINRYPNSPWAAEATLHMGCEARYQGRFSESGQHYQDIINKYQTDSSSGAKRLTNKAHMRLAVLKTLANDFKGSALHFKTVYQNASDWRERTYASHWLTRIARYQADQLSLLDCGTKALAYLLDKQGDKDTAETVRQIKAASLNGHSMAELQSIAIQYGYHISGRKLTLNELKHTPLPVIVQINARSEDDKGHYWIVETIDNNTLSLHDPQSQRRFKQSMQEFARQWQGNALTFAVQKQIQKTAQNTTADAPTDHLLGRALTPSEMITLTGGCCGLPRAEDELGKPNDNTQDDDLTDEEPPCGEPKWQINQVNLNFFMQDIPLWYQPKIGPAVGIDLSYNSQSAFAFYEPFGNKWQFNYASYLVVDPGASVTLFMPDGRRDVYSPDAQGNYVGPARTSNILHALSANRFELEFTDGSRYIYDIPTGTSSIQPYLIAIDDPHGNSLHFGYNSATQLNTITDAQGDISTLTYNNEGLITRVNDPFGRSAVFTYDNNRNLITITDMGGIQTTLNYDDDAYLSGIDYGQGLWDINIEPAVDNVSNGMVIYPAPGGAMWSNYRITITSPEGAKQEYYFDGYHQTGWYVSPEHYINYENNSKNNYTSAQKTQYTYRFINQLGVLSSKTSPTGSKTSYYYDSQSNRTGVTLAGGEGISMSYNQYHALTQLIQPNGTTTDFTYADNHSDLLTISNELGGILLEYNASHDITKITDRNNNVSNVNYNDAGQISQIKDAADTITQYTYNTQHQLTEITRAGQRIAQYTYDDKGRIANATGADKLTRTYQYDNLNRLTHISYPDGKTRHYHWSAIRPALLDKQISRSQQTQQYQYAPSQQLTIEVNAEGGRYQYEYSANGNLQHVTDANNNRTNFYYDADNRLIKTVYIDPQDGNTDTSYIYDSNHRLSSKTNARGITSNYTYDVNSNLTTIAYSDNTQSVSFLYDKHDRLIEQTDDLGISTFTYDANSNVTYAGGPWSDDDVFSYTYDALNRRTSMTTPSGAQISYHYDAMGRRSKISKDGQDYTFTYADTTSPVLSQLGYPGGTQTDYQHDSLLRTTRIGNSHTTQGLLNQFDYTYNSQDLRGSETITQGNPVSALTDKETHYGYNTLNQLLSSTSPDKHYQFDADGNMTQGYTIEGFVFTASYDAENRMTQLNYTDNVGSTGSTGSTGGTQDREHKIQYRYSARHIVGEITKYIDNTLVSTTRFVRDGFLPVEERNANSQLTRQYLWRSGAQGGIGQLLSMTQNSQRYDYLYDGKGNVSALIDSRGTVVAQYRYDAFGVLLAESGTLQQPIRFSSKYYDAQTGLSDYGYRFYSAVTGRWMNRDPIGMAGGMNLYGFVGNNAVNWVDPFGLRKYVPLGDGWNGGIDTFDVNGKSSFEIHVKDPKGNEVGMYGPDGWFNKHGLTGRPDRVPDKVENSCRSRSINLGRRMSVIPQKGRANIKGDAWKRFFKGLPLIGPMSEALKPSPLYLPEDHPAR